MAKKSTSSTSSLKSNVKKNVKETIVDNYDHSKLEKQIADLQKEIKALKEDLELAKKEKPVVAGDPENLSALIETLIKLDPRFKRKFNHTKVLRRQR